MKTCSACGNEQPTTEFNRDKRRADGLFPQCKTCRKQKSAEYRANNRGELNQRKRVRTAANPGLSTEAVRRWRAANPDAAKVISDRYVAVRRARIAGAEYEPVDLVTLRAEHGGCYLCGHQLAGEIHMDHVVPLARGGGHRKDNVLPAHAACNLRKGDHLLSELDWLEAAST